MRPLRVGWIPQEFSGADRARTDRSSGPKPSQWAWAARAAQGPSGDYGVGPSFVGAPGLFFSAFYPALEATGYGCGPFEAEDGDGLQGF